jgi:hypothetical protein
MPCKCIQVSKVPLAGKAGVYQYTFKCTTSDGRTKKAVLAESDDRRARLVAEFKCEQVTARE